MSLGQPTAEFQKTCPKCGAVQESPGSTFCEECGTDLRPGFGRQAAPQPRSMGFSSQLKPLSQLQHIVGMPVRFVKRGIETLVSLISSILRFIWRVISFGLRTAVVLLLIGGLIIGLSFVPEVRARVPAIKEAPAIAKQLLQRAVSLGAGLVRRGQPKAKTSKPRSTSQQGRPVSQTPKPSQKPPSPKPAAIAQTPASARAAALRPLYVKSTPSGATVQVNARPAGKTPITLKVPPGTHKVTISRQGYTSVTRTVTVRAGKSASLNVKLVARRTPSRTAPKPKTPAVKPSDP